MNDIVFIDEAGSPLPIDVTGNEALFEGGEFDGWRVRWRTPTSEVPFVRAGDKMVPLERDGSEFVLPEVLKVRSRKELKSRGFSGVVTLFGDAEGRRALLPWLRITPTNVTPEEYEAIIADLRMLAFKMGVSTWATEVEGSTDPVQDGPIEGSVLEAWLTRAQRAIDCLSTLERQHPLIVARPARVLSRVVDVVDRRRAMRLGAPGRLARLQEGKERVRVPVLSMTEETLEGRFLAHVRSQLLLDGAALRDVLRARLRLEEAGSGDSEAGRSKFGSLVSKRSRPATTRESFVSAEHTVVRLDGLIARVSSLSETPGASGAWNGHLTNALLLSQEYGPIARSWLAYRQDAPLTSAQVRLLKKIEERQLASSWLLFERWVLVRMYVALLDRGFRVPAGSDSLLDELRVEDGSLAVKNRSFRLQRSVGKSQLEVDLGYEKAIRLPTGEDREPDIVIRASLDGQEHLWVFDVKYKDYDRGAPSYQRNQELAQGSHFYADVFGIAEERYRRPMNADIAGIIHNHDSPNYLRFDQGPKRDPPPHTLLAIPIRPGPVVDSRLTALFRLLFGYRLNIASVCWRCGSEAEEVPEQEWKETRSVGTAYFCPSCTSFWVVSWCKECGTGLHKFGRDSFHRVEKEQPFNVHCPRCGDFFDPRGRAGSSSGGEPHWLDAPPPEVPADWDPE